MSVQFGTWSFEGQPPASDYIEKVSSTLTPYGPDSSQSYSEGGIRILYRGFHTTKEAHREAQPHIAPSGAVVTWDGRLDNRADLINEMYDSLTISSTDIAVVAAAYEEWGVNCFARLSGDWAVSIWNPDSRCLLLAKDPIGTRHLYYSIENDCVTWCTILDPLVLFAGKTFALNEEYIAGWFAILYPAAHLTPYVGIHSVPPSSSVLLRPGKHIVSKYWEFSGKRIRYRTDAEYEEHFRTVFATAVQRRLRSDRPVLAELSGGLDSSPIVCMADTILARGTAETPRLDTITWYDDSNPNWGERLYVTKVEEKRGRAGCHIDFGALRRKEVRQQGFMASGFESDRFAATPFSTHPHVDLFKHCAAYMRSQGHRVVLSGIGGESATGGTVPTASPELQNLLTRGQFLTLARQLRAWAAKMRKPRLPLLWEAIRGFLPIALIGVDKDMRPAPWFHSSFVRRNYAALCGYPCRMKLSGPLPSFQDNFAALDSERRFVAYCPLQPEMLRDVRLPYLDKDLLEFMYAIPREQVVRVGERRSLMRRALVGIVPEELLNRKKKPCLQQETPADISTELFSMVGSGQHMVSGSMGIIDPNRFLEALQTTRRGESVPISNLRRSLTLEFWLRHLTVQGVLRNSMSTGRNGSPSARSVQEFS
jgi:asparagine synthase (glutamine-hydrolysing)